ncbi:hypothetical protein B0T19DRAFT_398067 [Cercophora scortea]|uniref:Uncharacterized protein n=1 Tax=Cercophora scortea TaxID=314031 RepID=A0AAE0IVZ3_9PEZI|nr:hypothetical protein B0T19DRAFT_398067 [Cercophora scortea]
MSSADWKSKPPPENVERNVFLLSAALIYPAIGLLALWFRFLRAGGRDAFLPDLLERSGASVHNGTAGRVVLGVINFLFALFWPVYFAFSLMWLIVYIGEQQQQENGENTLFQQGPPTPPPRSSSMYALSRLSTIEEGEERAGGGSDRASTRSRDAIMPAQAAHSRST